MTKNTIILALITFVFGVFLAAFFLELNRNNNDLMTKKTVSIHEYNETKAFLQYVNYESLVKSIIINDLINGRGLDTNFIKNIRYHLTPDIFSDSMRIPTYATDKNLTMEEALNSFKVPTKERMSFLLDSFCIKYYESIPFMFMDRKHDSTWVKNSDTYRITKEMINDLKRKR